MDEVTTQSRSTAPVEALEFDHRSVRRGDAARHDDAPHGDRLLRLRRRRGRVPLLRPAPARRPQRHLGRIKDGRPGWIVAALCFELLSFGGYVILFRVVFTRGVSQIGWRESYEITMAGVAATRLFATAGAGGMALTAWALRRSGMPRDVVACRMVAFLSCSTPCSWARSSSAASGSTPGSSRAAGRSRSRCPGDLRVLRDRALRRRSRSCPRDLTPVAQRTFASPRMARWAQRLAVVPESTATRRAHGDRDPALGRPATLGAVAWWGFDIAALWACFHAFGEPPAWAVLIAGLLPRPARQHVARAGRDRRRWRAA